jgi:hypothetical protein
MAHAKAGRNDLCPCGSGKKYKKCCEAKEGRSRGAIMMMVFVGLILAAGIVVTVASLTGPRDVSRPSGVWSPEHGHYH